MLVDDRLVYRGVLRKAPPPPANSASAASASPSSSVSPPPQSSPFGQTILFTNDPGELLREGPAVYTAEELAEDTAVVFIDEGTEKHERETTEKGGGLVRPHTTASRNRGAGGSRRGSSGRS